MIRHLLLAVGVSFAGVQAATDSARLQGDTLLVTPIGVAVTVPSAWVTGDFPVRRPPLCIAMRGSTTRFTLDRTSIARLASPGGQWDPDFAAAVDSVLPLDAVVAHFGAEGWGADGRCFGDLQVRVYVTPLSPDSVSQRAGTIGHAVADRRLPSVASALDSAAWRIDRLRWFASYGDYGSPALVEFYSRRAGDRTVVLVFMYAANPGAEAERTAIVASFRTIQRPDASPPPRE